MVNLPNTQLLLTTAQPINGRYVELNINHSNMVALSHSLSLDEGIKHPTWGDEGYSHGMITAVENGVITLSQLPYRATRYPVDGEAVHVYQSPEGKLWAIGQDTQGRLFTMFANENTSFVLVCQKVDSSKTKDVRIAEKLAKGYVYDSVKVFDPLTRKLI